MALFKREIVTSCEDLYTKFCTRNLVLQKRLSNQSTRTILIIFIKFIILTVND